MSIASLTLLIATYMELKKIGNIKSTWRYGDDEMKSDTYTKNFPPSLLDYHGHKSYGKCEYSFG